MTTSKNFFGSDGIRGPVGQAPMTVDKVVHIANAVAQALVPVGGTVLIGKDPRVSSYVFESALEAGFVAAGVNVDLLKVMPTPGTAYLTKALAADLGIEISASHNACNDNGIKFFTKHGHKLTDENRQAVLSFLDKPVLTQKPEKLGRTTRNYEAITQYQDFCLNTAPGLNLKGKRLVVDGANGATFKIAPSVFAFTDADLVTIGCSPNGTNINQDCGSTSPERLQKAVVALEADVGIAFDGDGDRLVMVDHTGKLYDGDAITYIIAMDRLSQNTLQGPVVGTVMSNLGLEHSLRDQGIDFIRTQVGDRHIMEALKAHGGIIGGESSGHVLCLDKATTGDGIVAALQVLMVMQRQNASLSDLVKDLRVYPQHLINVPLNGHSVQVDEHTDIQQSISQARTKLGDASRIVVRASGTEPVVRVMVEGEEAASVKSAADAIAKTVAQAV